MAARVIFTTSLLTLGLGWLPVTGVSDCPRLPDIETELASLRGPSDRSEAWVEVTQRETSVALELFDRTGGLSSRRVLREPEQTCMELAESAARIIRDWEQDTNPEPASNRLKVARRPPRPRGEIVEDGEHKRGLRIPATLLGAAAAVAIPLLISTQATGSARGGVITALTLGFGPPIIAALALAGHRVAKGRGNYGFAILGAMIGCGSALAVLFVPGGRIAEVENPALIVPAAALAVGLPVLMLELSDARERNALQLAAVPIRDGLYVGVSGKL